MSLALAILGLLVGPALYAIPHWRTWDRLLDAFTLTAVGGLCVFHLFPEALEHGGVWAVLAGVAGIFLPRLLDSMRLAGPWALLLGLMVHAAVESTALGSGGHAVGIAVLLHRVPVGLAVFATYHEHPRTSGMGWVAIALLILATLVGFALPLHTHGSVPTAMINACVAGMLLHVVWETGHAHHSHDHHDHGHAGHDHDDHGHAGHDHGHAGHDHGEDDPGAPGLPVAVAAVAGLAVAGAVLVTEDHSAGRELLETGAHLTLETAPALVIAYVLAGVLHGTLGSRATAWLRRGGSLTQAMKGVGFGLPLPVCSCGVLPLYETLVKRGVPATAAMGFLIATPELGLDALLISVPLLGGPLTLARLVAAFVVALGVALWVGRSLPTQPAIEEPEEATEPLPERLAAGLRFGLGELVDHTLPWIALGLGIAAFAAPLLNAEVIGAVPWWAQVPAFALIGIPVYVCASGATPLAAVAIAGGVSPGAALAFLLAGPATNVTTFGLLSQLHDRATAVRFGLAVGLGAVLCGWVVDWIAVPAVTAPLHGHLEPSAVQLVSVFLLLLLALASIVRQGPRGMVGQITDPVHQHG